MKRIIVLGGSGQLAQCIRRVESDFPQLSMQYFSSKEANISDVETIDSIFCKYRPQVVINCAAYTAVDLAEDHVEEATLINTKGPSNIAKLCEKYNSLFIHISTDFVFEGTIAYPLKETDPTRPLSVYGRTKLNGEKEVMENAKQHIIFRTSWLYSEFGNNFAKTMLRLGKERESLGVVADQIGTPTYAMDLARVIVEIADKDQVDYGIYHYSNEGVASWYDFAHAIFDFAALNVKLSPISTLQFPTKAIRPGFSVMDKSKIKAVFDINIAHWQDSLKKCLLAIKENESKTLEEK